MGSTLTSVILLCGEIYGKEFENKSRLVIGLEPETAVSNRLITAALEIELVHYFWPPITP